MLTKARNIRSLLSIPRLKLPSTKIAVTVDLEQPCLDGLLRGLIEGISNFGIPLTIFSPNFPLGQKGYEEIEAIAQFAQEKGIRIEIGSHSLTHESLKGRPVGEVCLIIERSVSLFLNEGIPVYGFRAPYLSIEANYRSILSALKSDLISYDSSVLYEGNLLHSSIHDLLSRKCPHRIGPIWELPLSCLDDSFLLEKSQKPDAFVSSYWKKKMDMSLRDHHYFLLLIHPHIVMKRFGGLEDFLIYATQEYPKTCFTTCHDLVRELNNLDGRKHVENEAVQAREASR